MIYNTPDSSSVGPGCMSPASGRFASSMPKAIGSNNSGSNFLTIAKNRKMKDTPIITACCHVSAIKPELSINCLKISKIFMRNSLRLTDNREHVVCRNGAALGNENLLDGAVSRGDDIVFHLHGFQNEQHVTGFNHLATIF